MSAPSDRRPTATGLAGKALTSAAEAWSKMKPLVISTAVACAILSAIFTFIELSLGGRPQGQTNNAWLAVLQTPLQAAIDAPLAIAIHRLILKGEVTPGIISFSRPYHWLFSVWLCVIAFVEIAATALAFFAAGRLLALVAVIGSVIFFIKSALIFPAIAIEAPANGWRGRLQTSWRQMDGNSWIFLRALLLTMLPLVFIIILISVGIGLGVLMVSVIAMVPIIWVAATRAVMAGIAQPAGVMLVAAVASWLYLWVRDNQAGHAQSAQTATSTVT